MQPNLVLNGREGSLVILPEERARMFLHSPDNYHGKGGEHQKRKEENVEEMRGRGGGEGGKKPKGEDGMPRCPKLRVSLEDSAGAEREHA